eukprot:1153260-Pelagomonas_calceolata.AAC.3
MNACARAHPHPHIHTPAVSFVTGLAMPIAIRSAWQNRCTAKCFQIRVAGCAQPESSTGARRGCCGQTLPSMHKSQSNASTQQCTYPGSSTSAHQVLSMAQSPPSYTQWQSMNLRSECAVGARNKCKAQGQGVRSKA